MHPSPVASTAGEVVQHRQCLLTASFNNNQNECPEPAMSEPVWQSVEKKERQTTSMRRRQDERERKQDPGSASALDIM